MTGDDFVEGVDVKGETIARVDFVQRIILGIIGCEFSSEGNVLNGGTSVIP